jgi:hypothetical protein
LGEYGRRLSFEESTTLLMIWDVELWGEGPTDHRALGPIVMRTLRDLAGLAEQEFSARVSTAAGVRFNKLPQMLRLTAALPGPKKEFSPFGKKILQALTRARSLSPQTLFVVIWDHDVEPARLKVREEVNSHLRQHGQTGAVAAVCVQELEAWLVADPKAFKDCFGRGPQRGVPGKPEDEREPKEILASLLAECAVPEGDRPAALERIADYVDLGELAHKCSAGYGTFRRDAKELLCPILTNSG